MDKTNIFRHQAYRPMLLVFTFILIVSLACNMPGFHPNPTATPTPSVQTPIPTSQPSPTSRPPANLPPSLVEATPLPGSEIALKAPIVLAFNQAMNKASVEGALQGQPALSGKISWIDDSTLSFTPDQALLPATKVSLTVNTSAKAANGLALTDPVTVSYVTAEPLRLVNELPSSGVTDAAPSSAVVASFNQPVVALGSEDNTTPAAFSLQPSTPGHGEWINTSTYIYYPDPALAGGMNYTIQLNTTLTSTNGTTFEEGTQTSWSFTTATPKIDSVDPASPAKLRLDGPIVVNFNITMGTASVESNFALKDPNGNPVPGKFSWNDSQTSLTFTPDNLLARNTTYTLQLKGDAQAFGGVTLGSDYTDHLQTYSSLAVQETDPVQGGTMVSYGSGFGTITITFNNPVEKDKLNQYFTITPAVSNLSPYLSGSDNQVSFSNYFLSSSNYTLTVSADLPDAWGGKLGQAYQLHFRTPPASPALYITATQKGSSAVFLTPEDTGLAAQATNITKLSLVQGKITLGDLTELMGENGYNIINNYQPANPYVWNQALSLTPDRSEVTSIQVAPGGKSLAPGLYFLSVDSPQLSSEVYTTKIPLVLVVSSSHLTLKMSATQAFVWAVNLDNNTSIPNAAISIYDENSNLLASGQTDEQGLFQADIKPGGNSYQTYYAMLEQPGDSNFGLTLTQWSQGIAGYDSGITTNLAGPFIKAYTYTDRPIYRPGQTVNFRSVLRQENNGRYTMPDISQVTVKIWGDAGYSGQAPELFNQQMTLSSYGTIQGMYTIPADARPGYYQIQIDTGSGNQWTNYLGFQIANYQKPEINLQVELTPGQIQNGQSLTGKVNAQYFFGAPAGNIPVSWSLYRRQAYINLPQYQVGLIDTSWMQPYWFSSYGVGLGSEVASGNDVTAADGTLTIALPADILLLNDPQGTQTLTLEVTVRDENDQPVSERATATMHPSSIYIGIRPDAWSGQAGSSMGFGLKTVDWQNQLVGNKALSVQFSKIVWVQQPSTSMYDIPEYKTETTLVATVSPTTSASGEARVSFTPQDPGTYLLDVTGGGAHSQDLIWVSGPGNAIWPNLSNEQMHMTADADKYQSGQTAKVFIPNPFGANTLALITLERERVMSSQVITISEGGYNLSIPLSDEDAPNVYLSVTLIGRSSDAEHPDFRQGYLNLVVTPAAQTLKVEVSANPSKATAGQDVTLSLKVSNALGKPVQGEFSLGVVDLAALALAEPNSEDILTSFYGIQPLGVRTAIGLNGYGGNIGPLPASFGRGGGGGGDMSIGPLTVRENFQDTAYWNPSVVTGPDGTAQVSLTLPDNLTTWQIDVRGLTTDSLVGQATTQLITTKDLLIRPQTPSFMVVGDHTQLAAIVNNNTTNALQVAVSLQSNGFTLDDPAQAVQTVSIPANGHTSVTWWGTVQDVAAADLVFKASSGNLQDSARPEQGKLAVLHYSSPQTFSTSGVLSEAGSRLEVVSLPHSFTPTGGQLSVELSPSLAATLVAGLKFLDNPDQEDTAAVIASFLPNLETAKTLSELGISAPDLQSDLDIQVNQALNTILNHQNNDGGWVWWRATTDPNTASDTYITALILFALGQAEQAGYTVNSYVLDNAKQFLSSTVFTPQPTDKIWDLDRLAFTVFALQSAGGTDQTASYVDSLYSVRNYLSPWSQAMTALVLDSIYPGDERVKTMISDLEAAAIRTSTGANWESTDTSWRNPSSTIITTAIVLYAVAQKDPVSTLVTGSLRYLMANRNSNSWWGSAYETGWVLMALTEALKGTGELQASYNYDVTLNDSPTASGEAGGPDGLTSVTSVTPLNQLDATQPNALVFNRDAGPGRLYYRADLQVNRPVESATALSLGLSVERAYYLAGQDCTKVNCQPITQVQMGSGAQTQAVTVRLTLTLPHDMYNLEVEDYIPAGTTIFNPNLLTSQLGLASQSSGLPQFKADDPFQYGWGWWMFSDPQIYDDHILWTANYVPAGTYQLTYSLIPIQAGEFRVIPAHAWEAFFPEVQGTTAGDIFKVVEP